MDQMVLQTPNYKEIAKLFIVHYSLLRSQIDQNNSE